VGEEPTGGGQGRGYIQPRKGQGGGKLKKPPTSMIKNISIGQEKFRSTKWVSKMRKKASSLK